MKQNIFRKSVVEKMMSVEQLDKMIKVTSPMSWLALLGVTAIIAVVLVWSVTGTLPSTVTAPGMIVSANTSANTFVAPSSGIVSLMVDVGEDVSPSKDVVAVTQNGAKVDYRSSLMGYVSEVLVQNGDHVEHNAELFRVRPWAQQGQPHVVVCYVPLNDASKIERGMPVQVTLTSADSNVYGHMQGYVLNVDQQATSTASIQKVVGSGNSLDSEFTAHGPVCAVTCVLAVDDNAAEHNNVYYWTNQKGFELTISDNTKCTVRIITEEVRPITKLFTKLKEIWKD